MEETEENLPDLREVYDMDEDYNLLSWEIPALELTLKLGDKFLVEGKEKTLTEMSWSADMLGIHAMRPIFDEDFMVSLPSFVRKIETGEIKSL